MNKKKEVFCRKLFLIFFLILLNIVPVFAFSGSGSGTSGDPYQITSWAQLQEMNNARSSYYILMNNLDLTDTGYDTYASCSANGGAGWTPVGDNSVKFTGNFNGANHTISDVCTLLGDYSAFFGYAIGATIHNVGILNITVSGGNSVGILIGKQSGGSTYSSYGSGTASGSAYVGFIGRLDSGGTATNCYSTANISGNFAGGMIGSFISSTITNTYSMGHIAAGTSVGGLVGYNSGSTATNSYWDNETSGQAGSALGTAKSTSQMMDISTFSAWSIIGVADINTRDTDYIWNIVDGSSYPFLSLQPIDFIPDTEPPEINLSYPTNTTYTNTVTSINFSIYDANLDTCWYSLDGLSNITTNCSENITGLSAPEGLSTWFFYANDTNGNESSVNVTFFQDSISPIVTKSTPITGFSTTATQILYTYVVSDTNDISNCSLTIDGTIQETNYSVIKGINNTFDYAYSPRGYFYWTIECYDIYGNLGTTGNIQIYLRNSGANPNGASSSFYNTTNKTEEFIIDGKVVNRTLDENENIYKTFNWQGTPEEQFHNIMSFLGFYLFEKAYGIMFILALIVLTIAITIFSDNNKNKQRINVRSNQFR